MATVKRINASRREPNWRIYQERESAQEGYTKQEVEFNEQQKEEIKEKLFSVVTIFKTVGKKIGSMFGEVGAFVGEVAGTIVGEKVDDVIASAIKFISWLF